MKVSQKGIDLIKEFEGFRNSVYYDIAGKPTIGYGTLIDEVDEQYLLTHTVTEKEAENLLLGDVRKFEAAVNKLVTSDITQNQFDSLVSFTYNEGISHLKGSVLLKKINRNPGDLQIRNEFYRWCFAGGIYSVGLLNRRKKEARLYFS